MTEERTMILNSKPSEEAIEKYGSVKEALRVFRKSVEEYGYCGIEKWMLPLVEEHGDLKDICCILFSGYYDADAEHRISEFEMEALYGLTQLNDESKATYELYRKAYMTLRESLFMYRSCKRQMFSIYHMIESDIVYYECAERIERFANHITRRYVDDVLVDEYSLFLEEEAANINKEGSLVKAKVTEDGELKLNYTKQLEVIKYQIKLMVDEAKRCKGYLDAVVNWVTAMDLEGLMPMEYRSDIVHLEKDFRVQTINPRWFKTNLKTEGITDSEKELALIPSFKSIRKKKQSFDLMLQRLNFDYGRL